MKTARLNIKALASLPQRLEAAKKHGKPSPCGQFIEVPIEHLATVLSTSQPTNTKPPAHLTQKDKILMALCGHAKTAWETAGKPVRTEAEAATLKAICATCEECWRGHKELPCRNQACTHSGRWAATYQCPAGKWPQKPV